MFDFILKLFTRQQKIENKQEKFSLNKDFENYLKTIEELKEENKNLLSQIDNEKFLKQKYFFIVDSFNTFQQHIKNKKHFTNITYNPFIHNLSIDLIENGFTELLDLLPTENSRKAILNLLEKQPKLLLNLKHKISPPINIEELKNIIKNINNNEFFNFLISIDDEQNELLLLEMKFNFNKDLSLIQHFDDWLVLFIEKTSTNQKKLDFFLDFLASHKNYKNFLFIDYIYTSILFFVFNHNKDVDLNKEEIINGFIEYISHLNCEEIKFEISSFLLIAVNIMKKYLLSNKNKELIFHRLYKHIDVEDFNILAKHICKYEEIIIKDMDYNFLQKIYLSLSNKDLNKQYNISKNNLFFLMSKLIIYFNNNNENLCLDILKQINVISLNTYYDFLYYLFNKKNNLFLKIDFTTTLFSNKDNYILYLFLNARNQNFFIEQNKNFLNQENYIKFLSSDLLAFDLKNIIKKMGKEKIFSILKNIKITDQIIQNLVKIKGKEFSQELTFHFPQHTINKIPKTYYCPNKDFAIKFLKKHPKYIGFFLNFYNFDFLINKKTILNILFRKIPNVYNPKDLRKKLKLSQLKTFFNNSEIEKILEKTKLDNLIEIDGDI